MSNCTYCNLPVLRSRVDGVGAHDATLAEVLVRVVALGVKPSHPARSYTHRDAPLEPNESNVDGPRTNLNFTISALS